jgi:hypothetical protein
MKRPLLGGESVLDNGSDVAPNQAGAAGILGIEPADGLFHFISKNVPAEDGHACDAARRGLESLSGEVLFSHFRGLAKRPS